MIAMILQVSNITRLAKSVDFTRWDQLYGDPQKAKKLTSDMTKSRKRTDWAKLK